MDNPVLLELLAIIRDPKTAPSTVGWAKGKFNDLVDIMKEMTIPEIEKILGHRVKITGSNI